MTRTHRCLLKSGCLALAALAASLVALPRDAAAISLELAPAALSPAVGDSFAVSVVVGGLGAVGSAPSVGAFELSLDYDEALLDLVGVDFGLLLGDPTAGEAFTDFVPGAGSVDVAEVSLLAAAALDALQPASFTLATVTFKASAAGESVLSLGAPVVSDANGRALGIQLLGSARVTAGAPAVPEPAALVTFATGALIVAWRVSRGSERESRER